MQFWVLSPPENTAQLATWDEKIDFDGSIHCQANPGHTRPDKRSSELKVVLPPGPAKDFIWTWLTECLIADRVWKLFNERGFTGYESKYASGLPRNSTKPISLRELIITGWGGVASVASGIRLIEECRTCGHRVYSGFTNPAALIDEAKWDGSDLFMVWPLPRYMMVSNRVHQDIMEAGLTGGRFYKLIDLQPDPNGTLTPVRLSRWMPQERAKELGESLGIA